MIFIFDFDYTLFNTGLYKDELISFLDKEYGINSSRFFSSYKNFFNEFDLYQIEKHLSFLGVSYNELSEGIFFEGLDRYIFPDALKLLEIISQRGHTLEILSRGDELTQKIKMKNLFLDNYFNKVWIIQEEKDLWIERYSHEHENFYFINDNVLENISILKKISRGNIFLIDGPYARLIKHDHHIYDFAELSELFSKILL